MVRWRRHANDFATSRLECQTEEPAMWRNVIPCDQPAVQENDFELISTVTMESRHSIDGTTGCEFSSIYIVGELWGLKSEVVERFPKKLPFWKKSTPYGEIFKILFQKDSSTTCCVQISWNLADRKLVKSRVAYLTKKTKFRFALSLSLLRQSRPKSARASGKQCTQSAPNFIQIIAERVNTVHFQMRHKVFPVLGEATASSPSDHDILKVAEKWWFIGFRHLGFVCNHHFLLQSCAHAIYRCHYLLPSWN